MNYNIVHINFFLNNYFVNINTNINKLIKKYPFSEQILNNNRNNFATSSKA